MDRNPSPGGRRRRDAGGKLAGQKLPGQVLWGLEKLGIGEPPYDGPDLLAFLPAGGALLQVSLESPALLAVQRMFNVKDKLISDTIAGVHISTSLC
jgi:hypothetical protein